MKKKYSDAAAQKKAMLEGYHAVEDALRSLAEQAQDLRMGYEVPEADKRAFYAPEGFRRLTINLPEDLHKQMRLAAIERDCTSTQIIERLLIKELTK